MSNLKQREGSDLGSGVGNPLDLVAFYGFVLEIGYAWSASRLGWHVMRIGLGVIACSFEPWCGGAVAWPMGQGSSATTMAIREVGVCNGEKGGRWQLAA